MFHKIFNHSLISVSARHGGTHYNSQVNQPVHQPASTNNLLVSPNLEQQTNIYGQFDSSFNAISSRFDSGFSSDQLLPTQSSGGVYPVGSNNIYRNYERNSYAFPSNLGNRGHFPTNSHRMKRFSGTSNGVVDKNNPIRIALLENQRIMSSVLTPNNQVPNTVQGDVSVVDRHTSNIGKGLAENDRLTKILHGLDYKHGTLIVHGEALDMQNSRIGKGLAEHDRLNHQLQEIHVKEKNILVRGSKRAAMNKIRKGNALLRRNIAQIKQHRKVKIKLSMRQVRQENAKLRQQIALAQQKKLINPVSKALNENKRLKATLVHGDEQISVVNKHTSNIGKGLAEKERLTKILHDIRHGGDTLLVDGEILDMRTHRLGKGLTENERLNKILYEIQNDKDTIIVRGSKARKMKEIRKENALLRQQIIQAKHQRKIEQENTMKQIRQENAKLRNHIRQHP